MTRHPALLLSSFAAALLAALPAHAGHRHRHCQACAASADCAVEVACAAPAKPALVPVTVYRPEYRDETITVMRRVPQTHPVRVVSTVMESRTEMRTVHVPVSIPTWRTVTRQVTVMVPHTEMREGVRTVARTVRETVMQTVCRDAGHYECRTHVDGCGCTSSCRVWVPNVIREQVAVPVCRVEYEQQPYRYPVTVCKPELRVINERVCDVHVEMQARQVPYTYCVPRQVERVVQQTTYRCVPEEKVVRRMVMVPHVEYRPAPCGCAGDHP